MDAGEFAVEGAAGAETVGGRRVDGCAEGTGPEGSVGAGGEDLFFELAVGLDLFDLVRAGGDELGLNGEDAGAVVGGMNLDGLGEVARGVISEMNVDRERRRAHGPFDVDAGESEPGAAIVGGEELDFAAEPFAIDGRCLGRGDAEELGGAGDDGGGG